MTKPLAAALFVVLAAAAPPDVVAGPDAAPPEGLELVLTSKSKTAWPCGAIEWELTLANRSKTATHRVVLPNDGSESGMREPHVFFTASFVGKDGAETALPAHGFGRCGLFANAWWNDVVKLAPGESRKLEGAPVQPHMTFDWQTPGKLRLVAHYVWSGGMRGKSAPVIGDAPADLGGMRSVVPYELVSKPIDVEIVRPLDVVAKARGAFKVGRQMLLSDVIEARVVNRGGAPIELAPHEWTASVVNDADVHAAPIVEGTVVVAKTTVTLAVGAETPAVGAKGFSTQADVRMTFDKPGTARIAVVVSRWGANAASIRSNWVDVRIEE